MDALVTVATYYDFPGAHLAKTHLESAGIPAFLTDENVLTMHPLLWAAVGGIKVQVRENDTDAARAALAEQGREAATDQRDAHGADTPPADLAESPGDALARSVGEEGAASAYPPSAEDTGADAAADSDRIDDDICPRCGSANTQIVRRRLPFLAILLFGFPFGSARLRHKCLECGTDW